MKWTIETDFNHSYCNRENQNDGVFLPFVKAAKEVTNELSFDEALNAFTMTLGVQNTTIIILILIPSLLTKTLDFAKKNPNNNNCLLYLMNQTVCNQNW